MDIARSAVHGVKLETLIRFLWSVLLVEVEVVGLGRLFNHNSLSGFDA